MSTILDERPLWLRVLSLAVGLPGLMVVFFVLSFFSVPSAEHGWLPTTAIVLPFVLAILAGVGLGRRWRVTAAAALALSLLLGVWTYRTAPPEPERLAAVAAEVGTPAGWRTISSTTGGNTWGLFADYPRFEATHATSESTDEAVAQYVELLEADGWERETQPPTSSPSDDTIRQVWHRGRWALAFTVEPPGPERLTWHDQVAASETLVNVHVGY